MVEELRRIYFVAVEGAMIHKGLGNQELVDQYRMVMAYTARYKNTDNLGGLNVDRLPGLEAGNMLAQLPDGGM